MTSGFVTHIQDVANYQPRQRLGLGGDSLGNNEKLVCTVFTDDIHLEKGCGYKINGYGSVWEDGDEVQSKLFDNGWVDKTYDPDD